MRVGDGNEGPERSGTCPRSPGNSAAVLRQEGKCPSGRSFFLSPVTTHLRWRPRRLGDRLHSGCHFAWLHFKSFLPPVGPSFHRWLGDYKDGALIASSTERGSKANRAGGWAAPPQLWPYGMPSAEVSGGWVLAKQARGTGLGPDNPRSKQPVSSVSWEAAKTSDAGSFISPLAREPGRERTTVPGNYFWKARREPMGPSLVAPWLRVCLLQSHAPRLVSAVPCLSSFLLFHPRFSIFIDWCVHTQ